MIPRPAYKPIWTACFLAGLLALLPATGAWGQSAGAFSRMGFGARGIAMGNALTADASGSASPYYNPALAPQTTQQQIMLSSAFMRFDREMQFVQFATPIRPSAGLAAGLIHAGVSDIDGRDASGYHTQSYSTDEFAFFLAFGTRLGSRLTAGLGLQLFRADLSEGIDPEHSIGIDAGFLFDVTDRLRLALAMDDLLARYSWDTSGLYGAEGGVTSDRFPLRLRAGASYRLWAQRLQLLAEYESRVSDLEYRVRSTQRIGSVPVEAFEARRATFHEAGLRVGAEYEFSEFLAFRAGLDRMGRVLSGNAPSAGFAIEKPFGALALRAEYGLALEPHGAGMLHLITLRILL